MLRREFELCNSMSVQRSYSLALSSRIDINKQIRLRVVREFNLPDSIVQVLEVIINILYIFVEIL